MRVLPNIVIMTPSNENEMWMMLNTGLQFEGPSAIRYPRGKTLGGSSSINGLLWIRGQSNDYDTWRQQGNTGWGWEDVLPYFSIVNEKIKKD